MPWRIRLATCGTHGVSAKERLLRIEGWTPGKPVELSRICGVRISLKRPLVAKGGVSTVSWILDINRARFPEPVWSAEILAADNGR